MFEICSRVCSNFQRYLKEFWSGHERFEKIKIITKIEKFSHDLNNFFEQIFGY